MIHIQTRIAAVGLLSLLALASLSAQAETLLKPFVLASETKGELAPVIVQAKGALGGAGFSIVGEYSPYAGAHVIIVTNDELKAAATKSERGGYAAGQRVSVTKAGENVQVAYVNPLYIQHAYHVKADLSGVATILAKALGHKQSFGAEGMEAKALEDYHYAFGMEYFDDTYKLVKYGSYQEAVDKVESLLASNNRGIGKIYRIDVPGAQTTVFGVSMKSNNDDTRYMDDAFQMDVVDHEGPSKAAYLPYEVLVKGREVEALHMRFRMAVHFPDLKMMGEHSFMKLMRSPDSIHKALTLAVGGRYESSDF